MSSHIYHFPNSSRSECQNFNCLGHQPFKKDNPINLHQIMPNGHVTTLIFAVLLSIISRCSRRVKQQFIWIWTIPTEKKVKYKSNIVWHNLSITACKVLEFCTYCWGASYSVLPILCMLLVNSLRGSERGSIWGFALTVCVALLFLLFASFPWLVWCVSVCRLALCGWREPSGRYR